MDLLDQIQKGLEKERKLDPSLYELSPGQIWSHVDHRVARAVSRIIADEIFPEHAKNLYQITDPAEREKIYRGMYYQESKRASQAIGDTLTLLKRVARLLHGDDSVIPELEQDFTEKIGISSEEWLAHKYE